MLHYVNNYVFVMFVNNKKKIINVLLCQIMLSIIQNDLISSKYTSKPKMFMSMSSSLTNKSEKDLQAPLNEVYPVKEQRQTLPRAMLSLLPAVLQRIFHRPPETKQKEESARQCMSFEVGHLLSASSPFFNTTQENHLRMKDDSKGGTNINLTTLTNLCGMSYFVTHNEKHNLYFTSLFNCLQICIAVYEFTHDKVLISVN